MPVVAIVATAFRDAANIAGRSRCKTDMMKREAIRCVMCACANFLLFEATPGRLQNRWHF